MEAGPYLRALALACVQGQEPLRLTISLSRYQYILQGYNLVWVGPFGIVLILVGYAALTSIPLPGKGVR